MEKKQNSEYFAEKANSENNYRKAADLDLIGMHTKEKRGSKRVSFWQTEK